MPEILPLIPTLIGAGTSAFQLGKSLFGDQSGTSGFFNSQGLPAIFGAGGNQAFGNLGDLATSNIGTGRGYTTGSKSAFDAASNYYLPILQGNKSAVSGAISPAVDQAGVQYDTARRNINAFVPRGGGKTAALGQSYTNQARDVSSLISQARQNAASALTGIGTAEGGLGEGFAGLGGGNLATQLQSIIGAAGPLTGLRQQNITTGTNAGAGLAGILRNLNLGGGGSKSPTAATNTGAGADLQLAGGGDFITSRPTRITAGEAGPERVTVTPLPGSAGAAQPANFANRFGMPQMSKEHETGRRLGELMYLHQKMKGAGMMPWKAAA